MRYKIPCKCDPAIAIVEGYGSSYNKITLDCPHPLFIRDTVTIDACLKEEILKLWSLGIATRGCCCGHNLAAPFIQVDEEKVPDMLAMGYEFYYYGGQQHERRDAFYPLSLCKGEI